MPDGELLRQIENRLDTHPVDGLTALFAETLNWGRPKDRSFDLAVGAPLNRTLTIVPLAQLGGLQVMRVDWPSIKLPTVTERRAVHHALSSQFLEHLLCYTTPEGGQMAFVWARQRRDGKVETRTLPYQSGAARTTLQQLAELRFTLQELGLFGEPSVTQVTDKLNAAFDVERVTSEFFGVYKGIFEEAESALPPEIPVEQRRLYAQRFFNRLMFLAFLERKGWLRFNGRTDYLKALFADYAMNDSEKRREANLHRKRLNTLFFMGLNNSYERGLLQSDPQYKILREQIGEVPYLNGGLFEKEADDEQWFFPDPLIARILNDLIYRFNFTVTESTPLDIEVAVDPEMLGKIFEELVTGRHETGSYYTPKPVVAFMCRQALKGYLRDALSTEKSEAIERFVEERDPSGLRDPEDALIALRRVRACDPACGSGAYLVGLLHELLDLRACLFATRQLDAHTAYERKLEIIQHNLYGVDIDPFAVNIARLRLWLSLVVDDTRNPLEDLQIDVSLPNLDFKIEAGDSLIAADPSGGLVLGFRKPLVEEFAQAKSAYMRSHGIAKKALKDKAEKLREEIRLWSGRKPDDSGVFDWAVEFAEVFAVGAPAVTLTGAMNAVVNATPGQMELTTDTVGSSTGTAQGFDIVLANPPYVRADAQFKHIEDEAERQAAIARWKEYRERLKASKIYRTLYKKWDLYIPFLERAFQLLRPGGQMVYIVSDAYNAEEYTKKSHEFFLSETCVERLDFCTEIPLFRAGVTNTILHFNKTPPTPSHRPKRFRRWGEKADEFEDDLQFLSIAPQIEFGINLFKPDGSRSFGEIDGYMPLERICYISKGMVVHADDRRHKGEFRLEDLVSENKDAMHNTPFVEGKNLAKWVIRKHQWIEYGTERAPAKFSRPTFPEIYVSPEKLISMDIAAGMPRVVYDDTQVYHNHSAWSFVPWHYLKGLINKSIRKTAQYRHQSPTGDREEREKISEQFQLKYVLAIMNSSFARDWLKGKRRSKIHIYPDDWKQLPIAPIPMEEQMKFVEKVDAILAEFKQHGYPLPAASARHVAELERELDEMVAGLYGLEMPSE